MPLMIWSEEFSTKIPSIDRQHKVLIKYINELHDAVEEGHTGLVLSSILSGLVSYTKVHFAYEEMLFRNYHYPQDKEHLGTHKRLLEKVMAYKERFHNGQKTIAPELLEFLKYWLYHHILEEDMAYSDHLSRKGVR